MRELSDAAYRHLYSAHFPVILNYVLRRVNGPDDAADVVAETFLVAWRRSEEIPAGEDARLWLFGVARRVLANHARGERRRSQLGQRLRLELREDAVDDPSADLVEVLAVDAALGALEATDREVLELTVWDQLTPSEIGILLDLPAPVVRSRLFRARKAVRKDFRAPERVGAGRRDDHGGPGHVVVARTASQPERS
ncbi:RNA polymerase sigma factor [Kineosporia sp. NBRC 101731]|uniref:RNA polymerase sigma factor n=1 Tax=Kineosporia sp. NBRC 101731 TaxID=3032199 RepID=UPI0024A43893|nr:RNA polymerase sigma factor [Kineosporia sp. NBRC 101731]GLY30864.1 DNA-directed RNA polymerase sigma-70 factor [Kineosporia sp. NBRC 101731]